MRLTQLIAQYVTFRKSLGPSPLRETAVEA